jgi:cephalosporin-C deacetylase
VTDTAPHLQAEQLTGYPLTDLLAAPPAPPEPPDFSSFWQQTVDEFAWSATDVRVEREESGHGRPVQRISFRSSCGERVIGWLVAPMPGERLRGGLVISHGYGGRTEPDPEMVPPDAAAIFPVAPWLPDNAAGLSSADHVLVGIDNRYRYSHRYCVADIWRSATVLLERYPEVAGGLDYRGGSFGGGIGALALPWDGRFRRAVLDVPSFGDMPTRLSRPCTGSGEAVRRHLMQSPRDRATLGYFDAAVAARLVTIPVLVCAARLDPAVDARGQFAVYHGLAGPRRLVVRSAGHTDSRVELAEEPIVESAARRFLSVADLDDIPPLIEASRRQHPEGGGHPPVTA